MVNTKRIRYSVDTRLRSTAIKTDELDTLSNSQLKMAWSIAQYDVRAAYRYCLTIDAKNQMKCPFCRQDFSGWYEQQDGSMALVCTKCTPRKNRISAPQRFFEKELTDLEIKLNPTDYLQVCKGRTIKIDTETAKYQARKIKLIDEKTNNYVVRSLIVIGERGYFQ
jgi:Zn finger protein HypA/HybF involved in hydrogenase expression